MCIHTSDPSASPKQPIQEFWQILCASPKHPFKSDLSESPNHLVEEFWSLGFWGFRVLMLCGSSRSPPCYLASIRCIVQNHLAGWRSFGSFFNPWAARRGGKKVREEKGTQFLNWQLLQKPGTSLAYAPVSKAENPRVIYLYLSPQMFVQPSYFLPGSFKCIGEKLTCFWSFVWSQMINGKFSCKMGSDLLMESLAARWGVFHWRKF
jgi:hypothetical protein